MKYERLTKEQLEELSHEFSKFLATQGINAEEWQRIKQDKPQAAEEELDVFSDLVWEGVLNKVDYLEHFSPNQIYLFKFEQNLIHLIGIKTEHPNIDLNTKEGYKWLQANLYDDDVEIYVSSKSLQEDRNKDIFALMKRGAAITQGKLYTYFENMINNTENEQ